MLMRVRASCVGWEAAQINVGYGTADFFLNATGLQWNSTSYGEWLGMFPPLIFRWARWVGLLADGCLPWCTCDWFHGVPQLCRYEFHRRSGLKSQSGWLISGNKKERAVCVSSISD